MTIVQAARSESLIRHAVAVALMAVLLVHAPGLSLVPVSVFLGVALFPVIIGRRTDRSVIVLVLWSAVGVMNGLVLMWLSRSTGGGAGEVVTVLAVIAWVAAIPLIPALATWSFRTLSVRAGILLMLGGAAISSAVRTGPDWKGSLGIYVTALVLVLLARHGVLSFLALLACVGLSFANDARSMALAALMALVVQLALRQRTRNPRRWIGPTLRLIAAISVAAFVGVWVLISGLAGPEVQARTADQLTRVNALFGVRAEWASTLSLMAARWWGYGVGAQPTDQDRVDAVFAVQAAGGDWTSRYFSQIVLGERVDLHSTTANLWFHLGVPGLVIAALLAVLLFRGLRASASTTETLGLGAIFLILMAAWDLLFSPMADIDRVLAGVVVAIAVAGSKPRGTADFAGVKPWTSARVAH